MGGAVSLLHCHYGYELHPPDWEIIHGLIRDDFYRNGSSCFPEYRGARLVFINADEPAEWVFSGFDEFVGEKR